MRNVKTVKTTCNLRNRELLLQAVHWCPRLKVTKMRRELDFRIFIADQCKFERGRCNSQTRYDSANVTSDPRVFCHSDIKTNSGVFQIERKRSQISIGIFEGKRCGKQNFNIHHQRPIFDVVKIILDTFFEGSIPSKALNLCPSC